MSPDWKYRYFQYYPVWGSPKNERMASLDNGSGDGYFLVFSDAGAFLKGFDHESYFTPWAKEPMEIWPGVLEDIPASLSHCLQEPAFDMESTTFCIWRELLDSSWHTGPVEFPTGPERFLEDPDGSQNLLWMLVDQPMEYVTFCAEYYERHVDVSTVERFFRQEPLCAEMVTALGGKLMWEEAVASAKELRYPLATAVL